MTESEVKRIAAEAARAAVEETFLRFGLSIDEPLEVQRDFQHLRSWRSSVDTVKKQGLITAVGILTAGLIGLIWMAIRGNGS